MFDADRKGCKVKYRGSVLDRARGSEMGSETVGKVLGSWVAGAGVTTKTKTNGHGLTEKWEGKGKEKGRGYDGLKGHDLDLRLDKKRISGSTL
jgi:hypothetical protein